MPNNRNRNRNRNRIKRNQNQQQTKQQRQKKESHVDLQEEKPLLLSTLDEKENGNDGIISNGSSNKDSNTSNRNAQKTLTLAPKKDELETNTVTVETEVVSAEKQPPSLLSDDSSPSKMGAKSSKFQEEKREKLEKLKQQEEKDVEQSAVVKEITQGSPRQVKVIVHRIIREVRSDFAHSVPQQPPAEERQELIDDLCKTGGHEQLAQRQVETLEVNQTQQQKYQQQVQKNVTQQEEQQQQSSIQQTNKILTSEVDTQEKKDREVEQLKETENIQLRNIAVESPNVPKLKEENENFQKTIQVETYRQSEPQQENPMQQGQPKQLFHKIHLEQQAPQQSPPLQRSQRKVIVHQIRIESDEKAREGKGKPTIEEISSTTNNSSSINSSRTASNISASSLSNSTGTLSPPPRYLVESPSPKNNRDLMPTQFLKFASGIQIQELDLNSDVSSGEFNYPGLQSPVVSEVESETEGSSTSTPKFTSSPDVPSISRADQQEHLRQKRAYRRNALETHFLPQLLSPRYLDSILEENGEGSTTAIGDQQLYTENSTFGQCMANGNEMFPSLQLDFSRRYKRREEPIALMLETRLLEPSIDNLESCTRLESTLSPHSESAELVYLSSSASSSISDLELELELEQAAALAERTLVDLDTDATKLMEGNQSRSDDEICSTTTTTTEPATETDTETEVENEGVANEESRESTPVNHPQQQQQQQQQLDGSLLATTPTPSHKKFVANETKENSVSLQVASSLAATRERFVENMDKVRELIEMTRREEETIDNVNEKENGIKTRSPSPPPRPPPPTQTRIVNNVKSELPLISNFVLQRQESNDSHCSNSTQHSQCTTIQMVSPPPITPHPIHQQQQQHQAQEQYLTSQETINLRAGGSELDSIKKLRLLCTETLASMPYGEQVLEELASVAQNIAAKDQDNKMPYPMPDLPYIKELQLSTKEVDDTINSTSAWLGLPTEADPKLLVCLSPTQRVIIEQQQHPQQQQKQIKADQLLDDHQKFMERRGYNELTKEQVRAIDNEQQQQMLNMAAKMRELRKSLTPTPPPVPKKSAETAAKAAATSSIENKPKKQTVEQQQSSHSTTSKMSSTTIAKSHFPSSMENELARIFPSLQQQGDIFSEQRKRFSNIENENNNFPELNLNSIQTKRYSNIETKLHETKKKTENGQVIYDVSDFSHEKKEEGDKDLTNKKEDREDEVKPPPIPPPPMMSETRIDGSTTQANAFIKDDVLIKNSQTKEESQSIDSTTTYEEFRQRAKAAVDAIGQADNVFKDFDRLSQQLNQELESTREHREKTASLFDLSGLTQKSTTHDQDQLKQQRHAHMQELEREIERSVRSRQERMSSVEPRTYQIPIEMETNTRSRRSESMCNLNEVPLRPHTSAGIYKEEDDWARYASDLGNSENIARPFAREVEICYQRQRSNDGCIRAPRLRSASSNDLSSFTSYDNFNAYSGRRTHAPMLSHAPQEQHQRPQYASCYSLIERNPNPTYISTTSRRGTAPAPSQPAPSIPPPAYDREQRRSSLPRELHEQQLKYILSKEEQLKMEVARLQQERCRLMEEMQRAPMMNASQRRESYRPSYKLPTLSEEEVFRKQMAEEWMNKVAEREERKHQKIIRISKIEDEPAHLSTEQANISDEFLNRVKERRHKLSMPADSDWESGAESQPQPKTGVSGPESDSEPSVHVLEGQTEANLGQLPRHLREFAKFSTQEQLPDGGQLEQHQQQEKREDFTDNSHSSATKKSSIIKTYKVSRLPPSVQESTPTSTMFAPKFKARAPTGSGVWTPKSQTPCGSTNELNFGSSSVGAPTPPPPPTQPIWTPQPSPALSGRKEFRPVRFESPTLPRRYTAPQGQEQQQPDSKTASHWPYSNGDLSLPPHAPRSFNSNSDYAETDCSTQQFGFDPVAPSASVSDKIRTFERSASTSELQRPFIRRQLSDTSRPVYRPNEVIYKVKHEYMSEPETEYDRPRKMAQLGRRQYEGIGPVTNDGMPIILRSEVQEPHQHEWYKRLYQTIHKQKFGDDFVIRYKCPRARPLYKSNGYVSEPEPNNDSIDYSTVRYRTHNPHRVQSVSSAVNVRSLNQDEKLYGTMPNPIKSAQNSYKNQPGRIEDYTTGHSSVSEKEKKEWWDEVMDIFNGNLEQSKLSPIYSQGNLSRALAKESGYTSDSNLVFRKKELPVSSPLSPVEQKQAYKSLQAGGEPPLLGFRKLAPEKPKEIVEEFEFIQITPTLTKIRVSSKELKEEEPILSTQPPVPPPPPPPPSTSIQNQAKMFSNFSKNLPSFIPLSKKQQLQHEPSAPPVPPNRKSSCTKSTLRVSTKSRHEQCFQPPTNGTASAIGLRKVTSSKGLSRREPICRSKSTGAVATLLATLTATKETRNKDGCLTRVQHQQSRLSSVSPSHRRPSARILLALRQSSRSPVAFGRSISKERSFAEEKKRLENTLPANRTNFEASTNILRDPSLKSPQDVREAVRSYATCKAQHKRSRSLPRLPRHTTSTVSTTTRHTMCFPQVRPQNLLNCTRSPKKTPSKVKNHPKRASNDSLPRSNSTYSIDSIVREEEIVAIASPKTYVGKPKGLAAPLQNSRSEGHVPRKHRQLAKKPMTSDTVRDKTNFWNDYNAKQTMSLPQPSSATTTEYKFCSLESEDVYDCPQPPNSGCIEDLVWKFENKNVGDTQLKSLTDIARPITPQPHYETKPPDRRRFSPTREVRVPQREVRSPSRRRIDNLRSKEQVIARASSLSSADDRAKRGEGGSTSIASANLYHCGDLAHSATSLNQHVERHSPSCRYRNNCERFTELNRFYSTLERVGQLERATSSSNFHPLRKDADLLNFDDWRKVRLHERAEKELQYLVGKLQLDQNERDLHFRSKDINEIKWRQDTDQALCAKKKSVEDLRENFEKWQIIRQQQVEVERPLQHKWRRNTVADLTTSLETEPKTGLSSTERHLKNELVSTLSEDQIKKITEQLNQIYAGGNRVQKPAIEEQYVVTVEKDSSLNQPPNSLKVRCNSSITKEQFLEPFLLKTEEQSLPQRIRATRSKSPVVTARETRGAIAAKNAELAMAKEVPEVPPRPKPVSTSTSISSSKHDQSESREFADSINEKIQYFEERQYDEPPKTIYHAREDSSPDEAEVMRLIEQNMHARRQEARQIQRQGHVELSNSLTDLSGIYGERPAARVNFHLHSPSMRPPDDGERELVSFEIGSVKEPTGSIELYDASYRSRSLSPQSQVSACSSSSYLQRVYTGEVQKIKQKFESSKSEHQSTERSDFFGLSLLRKARSDPEFNAGSKDALVSVTEAEPQKKIKQNLTSTTMEVAARGRSRQRASRLMPHIDFISKTAALKREILPVKVSPTRSLSTNSNYKERLKSRHGSPSQRATFHTLSTSHPDLRDVNEDILPHLNANWAAHKHPLPGHVAFLQPEKPQRLMAERRAKSTTPPSTNSLAMSQQKLLHDDIFANQKFDPQKHRPKARYVPDGALAPALRSATTIPLRGSGVGTFERLRKTGMAVTFKDYDSSAPPIPPQPPIKGLVSPLYDDSDVNIHFKTPTRYEYKQINNLTEEALAIRQAEHMQKLYQEERRRKYLQELQDMNSRRHTDNFTPSQKSPIALNRYDDFPTDVTLKSLVGPKTVARALYNFQGQTSKELSFRKGDTIYIRRKIDANWFEGEHNAMIGLLPVSYVEIVGRDGTRSLAKRPSEGQARAKYNFQAQSAIELSLNKGELVTLTRRVDGNWFEGKIANRKGIFPVTYVEILTDIGAEDIAARTTTTVISSQSTTNLRPNLDVLRTNINNEFNTLTQNGAQPPNGLLKDTRGFHKTDVLHVDTSSEPLAYRALYKYRPQNSDELELMEGDLVHVLEKCDDGWFVGTSQRSGCFGTFPGNYVERA